MDTFYHFIIFMVVLETGRTENVMFYVFKLSNYVVRLSFCVISYQDIGNTPIKDIINIKLKFTCAFPLFLEGLEI